MDKIIWCVNFISKIKYCYKNYWIVIIKIMLVIYRWIFVSLYWVRNECYMYILVYDDRLFLYLIFNYFNCIKFIFGMVLKYICVVRLVNEFRVVFLKIMWKFLF